MSNKKFNSDFCRYLSRKAREIVVSDKLYPEAAEESWSCRHWLRFDGHGREKLAGINIDKFLLRDGHITTFAELASCGDDPKFEWGLLKKLGDLDVVAFALKSTQTEEVLKDRGQSYGDVQKQAYAFQQFQEVLYSCDNWVELPSVPRQSVLMIMLKASRIMTGNYADLDSWRDIAGYAELVCKTLED